MSYQKLEIWRLAQRLTPEIHAMTLEKLPRHELYEEGSQIRRSIKSVRSNIVEGYGRRRYKQDFIRFLTYAQASCDETMDHLHILHETGSLADRELFETVQEHIDELGRKLNRFLQSVERDHISVREREPQYGGGLSENRASSNEDQVSSIEDRVSSIQHPATDEETPH
jgi:four helix bundle protein